MLYTLKASQIYTEDKIMDNCHLLIDDDIIFSIDVQHHCDDSTLIDVSKYKIIPGLIDLHIHGCYGYDSMDSSVDALKIISNELVKYGVTSFLPTTVTSQWEKIKATVHNIRLAMDMDLSGALILGGYIEGPFISKEQKGAHPEGSIMKINLNIIEEIVRENPDTIKILTLAPELTEVPELIRYLKTNNINISLGHTNATFDETIKAIDLGADLAVHTFNGMRALHHREPGVVGAVLINDSIFSELIADNIHVHPAVMKILVKVKGSDKVILVSDSMRATGLPDGIYSLGDMQVTVKNSIAKTSNGSLAGSTLKLIDGVKNMIKTVGIDPLQAVHMASLNPAKYLKLDKSLGSIAPGKKANLTIIDDDFKVIATIINGKIVYQTW
ncbi:N-acetylglucosamine-6-phosphate deacetylase [Alkaliphilus peptidifermentans]|uniref:N-acetylglucosamine-6-phosphate deacetylase n=1 Tax=Alkaliphilus peptidifermentans DSM 18978 TaxID=1120976 RepID=A0A1G5FYB1_9FIRM|nr:N-acetylglucosamine-6-phosphate deacetylase [Alkaliphilus peptidifermentans]SCY44194.1 N-acetylgalactosamine 6-phosphate deacetylase [Alkaliphilus peptidifermentans DSM 18978]